MPNSAPPPSSKNLENTPDTDPCPEPSERLKNGARKPAEPISLPKGVQSIVRVERAELLAALQYLWLEGGKPNAEYAQRFIKFADDTKLQLDQCFACKRRDGKKLFPTALAVTNPGRTAMIFASHLTDRSRQAECAVLYQFLAASLDRKRVGLAQILLTKSERRAAAAFESAGFSRLAELVYMERKIAVSNRSEAFMGEIDWPTGVTLQSFEKGNEADFKQVIADSYVGTLDCPGLCKLRSIEDVFLGHQGTGIFDPELWTLVRVEGVPAAVLLLSVFADQDVMELTYLGVGPAARGLGLGKRLVALGLRQAAQAGKGRMTLAADEQNEPALRIYKEAGYRKTDSRTALVLPIGGPVGGES